MKEQLPPKGFVLYVNDFLQGTRGMHAEVVGLYVYLLAYEWRNGGPFDLWKTCGEVARELHLSRRRCADLVEQQLKKKFEMKDGLWFSPRLEAERCKLLKTRAHHQPGGVSRAQSAPRNRGRFSPARGGHRAG